MINNEVIAIASLNKIRSSPRKVRLITNLIRNKEIKEALSILLYSKKKDSIKIRKLLLSLLSNWNNKYKKIKKNEKKNNFILYIKNIRVDQGKTLKRIRPVPQGRGHRIKKKLSNVKVFLIKKNLKNNFNYGSKDKSNS